MSSSQDFENQSYSMSGSQPQEGVWRFLNKVKIAIQEHVQIKLSAHHPYFRHAIKQNHFYSWYTVLYFGLENNQTIKI